MYERSYYRIPYDKSRDAEQARLYRRVIRKIKRKTLADAQRDVLMALFNLHWKYKNKEDGCIRASRDHIAKLAKCSRKTVEVAMKRFREEGIIVTQKYGKGGRKPTVYQFSIRNLLEVYDPTNAPIVVPGELVHYATEKGVSRNEISRENRAGNANEYIYNTNSSCFSPSEPCGEDWWTPLLQGQDDSPHFSQPVNESFPFLEGRLS